MESNEAIGVVGHPCDWLAKTFVALGYAGWEPGQLEREILDNSWLSVPMNEQLVFEVPFEQRWQAAWQLLGVHSSRVSPVAGHA